MKATRIMVEYGKNRMFVANNWVVENAVENYKKEWTAIIRNRGWQKEINFRENSVSPCEVNENGNGSIRAYTVEGYKDVRVN